MDVTSSMSKNGKSVVERCHKFYGKVKCQASRRVARGNWLRNQRPWLFQSSHCGWNGGHGLQLWSSGQNLPLPFCAPQFGSLTIFLLGYSTQNYTVCNWFCTLCLISSGDNRLAIALWGAEKGCWWLVVVHFGPERRERSYRILQ